MHRQCEVRVSQARLLVSKQRKRNRDEKSPVAGVYVLLSYDGVHVPTETCRYIESPSWHRIAVFQLNVCDHARGDEASVPEQPLIGVSSPTMDEQTPATTSLNPFATTQQSLNAVTKTQSLNPFASDFVPPPSTSPPPPPPVAPLPVRTSMVLHLRVLSDSLISKEVLGDVAVDLAPLMESKGDHLAADRLGHVGDVPRKGLPNEETVAVDTWIALRQRTAELRVQILVKPCSTGDTADSKCTVGARHSGQPASLKKPRSARRNSRLLPPAAEASAGTRASRGGNSETGIEAGTGGDAWPLFDNMARDGIVKTSLGAEQRSLDDRLLEVQELYDFSAGGGYRKGRPDEEPGEEKERGTRRRKVIVPDWPTCERDAAQLRRDMQYAALRNRRQSIAWAEKLGSSSALQHTLRNPPAFGCLRREREKPNRVTKTSAERAPHQLVGDLEDLVVHGIPTVLQPGPVAVDASSPEEDRMGGAFEGGDQELSFLDDVTTAIPRVEVTRVLGSICCAEYHLQVKRESSHDSWFVVRRYSDFMELYNNLPRSFAAITPPLPPKSWRSLSFFSMTPEFLEARRVALEVALRRLAINAIRADAAVQADLRAFLGFPACPGTSWLSGLDAGVVRYLARVPPNIELALPALALAPIPVLSDLRVTMWMVLSGAAHKCSITNAREQYTALVDVKDEAEWCGQGGAAEDYALAAKVFETIDDDVNRTNVGDSQERERVRRVLKTFALKNPKTGYCQGMNSVALFLLRTAEGREGIAFWLLDALATDIIPGHWEQLSHISPADGGAVSIRALMGERMPELLEHLDSRGLPPEMLVCDFMMSLGCRALPPTSLLRCFDLLFWEGRDTLQYMALAVLRHAEDELLGVQGAIATSECLSACTAAMHDADSLVGMAWAEMDRGMDKPVGNSAPEGSPFDESP